MKEILFRGKLLQNGLWIMGYYCKTEDTTYAFASDYENHPVPVHHCILKDEMTDWGLPNRPTLYEVYSETVGEYTGLCDKNGKKIFEGDIVKTKYGRLCKVEHKALSSFIGFDLIPLETKNKYPDTYDIWCSENIEVIGNIHDNPEILKG